MFKPLTPFEQALRHAVEDAFPESHPTLQRLRATERLCIAYDASKTAPTTAQPNSPNADNETIALLITTFDDLMRWHHSSRKEWRAGLKHPERRMKYSQIRTRSGQHLDLLNSFLRTCSMLPGLVLTLTIPSSPKFVFTAKGDVSQHPNLADFRNWRPSVFERLVRRASFIGVALSSVLSSRQKLFWLSDDDDIIATPKQSAQAQDFIRSWSSALNRQDLDFNIVPLELIHDKLAIEDVLSIPDVSAGGIGEYRKQCTLAYGPADRIWLPKPPHVFLKASEVACWFGLNDGSLRKGAFSYDPASKRVLSHRYSVEPRLW